MTPHSFLFLCALLIRRILICRLMNWFLIWRFFVVLCYFSTHIWIIRIVYIEKHIEKIIIHIYICVCVCFFYIGTVHISKGADNKTSFTGRYVRFVNHLRKFIFTCSIFKYASIQKFLYRVINSVQIQNMRTIVNMNTKRASS